MTIACLACGTFGKFDSRNPCCPDCAPIVAQHVVRMHRAAITGGSIASCPCGWERFAPWSPAGRESQDQAVREHWRNMIAKEVVLGRCLSDTEQKAQGARCGCRGADDLCVCQNVPDRVTCADRLKGGSA